MLVVAKLLQYIQRQIDKSSLKMCNLDIPCCWLVGGIFISLCIETRGDGDVDS